MLNSKFSNYINSKEIKEMRKDEITVEAKEIRQGESTRFFKWKTIGIIAAAVAVVVVSIVVSITVISGIDKVSNFVSNGNQEHTEITLVEVQGVLEEIGELATYSYKYSGFSEYENNRTIFNVNIPLTKNSIKISYDGVIKVGYKVDDIEASVDNVTKVIRIKLPEDTFTDNILDEGNVQCEEKNNILDPISAEDIPEYLEEIKTAEMQQAIDKGIYEKAEEHAKDIVESVMSKFAGYTVVFM